MNGLIGMKKGMTQIFDDSGNVIPVTVVLAGPCIVTQLKTKDKDGYSAIQVGMGKAKKLNKPLKGHLKENALSHLAEFKVEKPEDFKIGQEIKTEIFKAGEYVSVSGISIGKGFAGNIKRHHHHRGPMSHGSKHHRIPGSIGAGTTPGRVVKGRKMPGRMGNCLVTVKMIMVAKVDPEKNLLMLKGSVPGKEGNIIRIIKSKEMKMEAVKV